MSKTVPERIADFLRQKRGSAFCHDCLAKSLGLERRQQARQATKPLGRQQLVAGYEELGKMLGAMMERPERFKPW